MAATVANSQTLALSPTGPTTRLTISTLVPDTSYPTGGYAVTPAQLGLANIGAVFCNVQGSAANNGAISATYNSATGKVQLWASSGTSPVGLPEATAAVNLSGITVVMLAIGV